MYLNLNLNRYLYRKTGQSMQHLMTLWI